MENEKGISHIGAWIGATLALLYTLSPIDILPDAIPFAGWLDDALVILTGGLNLIQSYLKEQNEHLANIVKGMKWFVIIIGLLAIAILALAGALIYTTVK